jgi:CBS domain-containing protein
MEDNTMTVATILRSKGKQVQIVKPDTPLQEIVDILSKRRIGAALVIDARGLVAGIVSERDIVQALATHGAEALQCSASKVMTKEVVSCRMEDTAEDLMEVMTRGRFRHVPVIEGGRLLGIVSIGDVVKRRIEDTDMERQAMREYIASAG